MSDTSAPEAHLEIVHNPSPTATEPAPPGTKSDVHIPWSNMLSGLITALAVTILLPVWRNTFDAVMARQQQRDELQDTAKFIQQETIGRLENMEQLIATASTVRQMGDRILGVMGGRANGNDFWHFYRFREETLEDLFLNLQVMSHINDDEPIDSSRKLRVSAINMRDGNRDGDAATPAGLASLRADLLRDIGQLHVCARSRDLSDVSHFIKMSARRDRLLTITP